MENKYSKEQLEFLNKDKKFQETIKNDDQLEILFGANENGESLDEMETGIVIGSTFKINGVEIPAPVTCVFSMLELIESPFVGATDKSAEKLDLERCLYVLCMREKSVGPIVEIKRLQSILDKIEQKITTPGMLEQYMVYQEKQAKEWAEFDMKALEFCKRFKCYNFNEAVGMIYQYLAIAGGFSMLPETSNSPDPVKKKETDMIQTG